MKRDAAGLSPAPQTIRRRRLGSAGPLVSTLGLGCMGISNNYGPAPETESIATIGRALDIGIDLLDTADIYGDGHNEELVGRAVAGRRQEAFIATKVGLLRQRDGSPVIDARPERIAAACDASLRRLGTEVIDLYYLHRVDPEVPVEDTIGAMSELVREGKVRYLGLSEAASATIRRAHAVHPIAALQSEYSLWTRDIEIEILPTIQELGIALVPYCPLGRGLLTGTISTREAMDPTDHRRQRSRFLAENFARNVELSENLVKQAALKGCTPAQLALAWLLAKGEQVMPIPGTKRRRWLDQNAAAAEIELSDAEVAALDAAHPIGIAAGDDRYCREVA